MIVWGVCLVMMLLVATCRRVRRVMRCAAGLTRLYIVGPQNLRGFALTVRRHEVVLFRRHRGESIPTRLIMLEFFVFLSIVATHWRRPKFRLPELRKIKKFRLKRRRIVHVTGRTFVR